MCCEIVELAGTQGLLRLNPLILQMRKLTTRWGHITSNIVTAPGYNWPFAHSVGFVHRSNLNRVGVDQEANIWW